MVELPALHYAFLGVGFGVNCNCLKGQVFSQQARVLPHKYLQLLALITATVAPVIGVEDLPWPSAKV